MRRLLISACLLGVPCRYDGAARPHPLVEALAERYELVPVCPEQLGGLSTPRPPAERQGDRVVTQAGADVTDAYRRGAEGALALCRLLKCEAAVLKERSPSCGHGEIYDGTFTGVRIPGDGVTAELLTAHGVPVYGESQIPGLLPEDRQADPGELREAKRQIASLLHKLRETVKTLEAKGAPGRYKSQLTLARRRIRALELAEALMDRELKNLSETERAWET